MNLLGRVSGITVTVLAVLGGAVAGLLLSAAAVSLAPDDDRPQGNLGDWYRLEGGSSNFDYDGTLSDLAGKVGRLVQGRVVAVEHVYDMPVEVEQVSPADDSPTIPFFHLVVRVEKQLVHTSSSSSADESAGLVRILTPMPGGLSEAKLLESMPEGGQPLVALLVAIPDDPGVFYAPSFEAVVFAEDAERMGYESLDSLGLALGIEG